MKLRMKHRIDQLSYLMTMLVLSSTTLAMQVPGTNSFYLIEGEFLHGSVAVGSDHYPLPGEETVCSGGWEPVELPDIWSYGDRHQCSLEGWYRFELSHLPHLSNKGRPAESWSIYLWRLSQNAEVYFNGELVGSGGSFEHPVGRNWNRPLFYNLPAAAWRDDSNEILIRLTTFEGWGSLPPPIIGPTEELVGEYEQRYFWQITINQFGFMLTCMAGFAAFVFWGVNRKDTLYFWIAVAATGWSIFGLHQFVTSVPLPPGLWWVIVHWGVDVFTAALCLAAHRLDGSRHPRFERVLFAQLGAGLIFYSSFRIFELGPQLGVFHLISVFVSLYTTAYLIRLAFRTRRSDVILFAIGMLVMALFGIQTWVLNTMVYEALWRTQFYLINYGAPVLMTLLLVNMARRFAGALRESEELNEQLESRVEQISNELSDSYAEQKAMEAERVANRERQRLYRDLHDDVGAKLLSLVYGSENEDQRNLAREALADVRSIVSEQVDGGVALIALMGEIHKETATRCELAGWGLDWPDHVDELELSSHTAYHLQRVLRELTTNALKHSTGNRLTFGVTSSEQELTITVADNGHADDELVAALNAQSTSSGMGLRNIMHRLSEIGGRASWEKNEKEGICCVVQIPLERTY